MRRAPPWLLFMNGHRAGSQSGTTDTFEREFKAAAGGSPSSQILGSAPALIEPREIVAIAEEASGFVESASFGNDRNEARGTQHHGQDPAHVRRDRAHDPLPSASATGAG